MDFSKHRILMFTRERLDQRDDSGNPKEHRDLCFDGRCNRGGIEPMPQTLVVVGTAILMGNEPESFPNDGLGPSASTS